DRCGRRTVAGHARRCREREERQTPQENDDPCHGRDSGSGARLWEDTGPMDGERRASPPLPISRRRFLERSAMAVAGGTLFACTGGKIVPHVSDRTAPTQAGW